MKKTHALLSLILLASFFLASCGPREDERVRAAREGILLLGNGTEPQTLDPQIATGVPENNILSTILEGLTAMHVSDDFTMEPGAAEKWEHKDFQTWTFHLRKDGKWSNGDPVTSKDFLFSWQRILEPKLGSQYAELLFRMKGAQAYNQGEITDFSEVGCSAPDDHTVVIELVNPTPFFPELLAHYSWFPVHEATVRAHGAIDDRTNAWAKAGQFIGNGAFTLEEWTPNQLIRVVKSETYWDKDNVSLNQVHFLPIDNENTAERAYQGGQLHVTNTLPIDKIPVYIEEHPEDFRSDRNYAAYFYRINTTREALEKIEVRNALAMAIDRDLLVETLLHGQPRVATGLTPNGTKGYNTPDKLKFDPEYARNLLKTAGYPDGEGFPPTEILINTSEAHKQIAEVVQEMWRTNLGIEVTIRNESWGVYLENQRQLEYQISRAGWNGDYIDPSTFLEMFVKDGGNNETGWSSVAYERLLEKARAESDPDRRYALLNQAEEILLTEMPIIPIYWYARYRAVHPSVENWNAKLLDHRPLKSVRLKVPSE